MIDMGSHPKWAVQFGLPLTDTNVLKVFPNKNFRFSNGVGFIIALIRLAYSSQGAR